MKKLKVVTVVGTRPEIIRLSRILAKLDQCPSIEHTLIHTGQNYDFELNEIFFKDLELREPDVYLNAARDNAVETIGSILLKIDPIFRDIQPDALLVLGDTNSCLCSIPAKKRKIPIFHMEAGNRCFDQRVPEEVNRKIIDHIADINLPYSDIAREYLLREGIPPDQIIKTGSPMYEVLNYYRGKIDKSTILEKLNLDTNKYFVVSAHREENIDNSINFNNLLLALNLLAEEYNYPVIVSTHPRTRNKLNEKRNTHNSLIKFLKPLSFSDYNFLQKNAFAVLSDSGTISEEASILKFPGVNLREAHERPEAMEETSTILSGLNPERILQSISQIQTELTKDTNFNIVHDYSYTNVSDKIIRIILGYVDYVNRVTWKIT